MAAADPPDTVLLITWQRINLHKISLHGNMSLRARRCMGTAVHWAWWGKPSITLSGMERFCNQTSKPTTHDSRDLECPSFPVPPVWGPLFSLGPQFSDGPGESGWLFVSVFPVKMGVRISKLPTCWAGKSYTWLFTPSWCLISLHLRVHANVSLTEQSSIVLLCHILFSRFLCDEFLKFFSMFPDDQKVHLCKCLLRLLANVSWDKCGKNSCETDIGWLYINISNLKYIY